MKREKRNFEWRMEVKFSCVLFKIEDMLFFCGNL